MIITDKYFYLSCAIITCKIVDTLAQYCVNSEKPKQRFRVDEIKNNRK